MESRSIIRFAVSRGRAVVALLSVLILGVAACRAKQEGTFQYVEVANGKFVPVKFPTSKPKDILVKFDGKVVEFSSPSGVDRAQTLLEHEGLLYLVAPAHSVPGHREKWSMRTFKQSGESFKEIPPSEYPRRLATINIWRPHEEQSLMKPRQWAQRYVFTYNLRPDREWTRDSLGLLKYKGTVQGLLMPDDVVIQDNNGRIVYSDQRVLASKLDTEYLSFVFSDIALLWFMLEIDNSFASSQYPRGNIAFLREFKAKYNPVLLSGVEPGEVPESERDF